jgi:hypothetical protein
LEEQLQLQQEQHQQQEHRLQSQQEQLQEQQTNFKRQFMDFQHQLQSRESEVGVLRQQTNDLQRQNEQDRHELQRLKRAEELATSNKRQEMISIETYKMNFYNTDLIAALYAICAGSLPSKSFFFAAPAARSRRMHSI